MLGLHVRLHGEDLETIGYADLPPPIEFGDLGTTERGEFRVVDIVLAPPGIRDPGASYFGVAGHSLQRVYDRQVSDVRQVGRQVSSEAFTVAPLDPPEHGLRLIGALDLSTVAHLEEALQRVAEGRQVTLDLSGLTFLDSSGLHALVRYARSQDGNGPVILDNPSAMMRRLLEITDLKDHPGLELRS